jgi:hypothetical protein
MRSVPTAPVLAQGASTAAPKGTIGDPEHIAKATADVADGSTALFEPSSGDFRHYPERRHLLAPRRPSKRAIRRQSGCSKQRLTR